jgi:hypothetical protein
VFEVPTPLPISLFSSRLTKPSCPLSVDVLYLQSTLSSSSKIESSQHLLRPFIDLITRDPTPSYDPVAISPIFQLSYLETLHPPSSLATPSPHPNVHIVCGPTSTEAMVEEETGRFAAEGERLFTAVFGAEKGRAGATDDSERGFFHPRAAAGDEDDEI